MAVKEIVPVFYLFVWLVMYIIYQFKLTNQARSNRTFIEYISKQSWFTVNLGMKNRGTTFAITHFVDMK